ncbi:MAG: branched-chain amino acid ABC transporter permease [Actinobacteria bacterium]|nr:branched-chain amino acid ABC transporter permease [Actinomycetota bacterium]
MDCNPGLIGPALITGLILGSLYALIALGYTMVYGVLKLINFAHDAVFAFGAVSTWYILGQVFGLVGPQSGLTLVIVLLAFLMIGGLASGGVAVGLERVAYRPLRKRHAARLSYLISAIGASFFATYMLQQDFLPFMLGPGPRQYPNVIEAGAAGFSFSLMNVRVTGPRLLVVVAAFVCFFILDRLINKTSTGRSIRALSEDPVAAQLMGVNVDRVIVTTFFVGGFFGGVAGALYGTLFGSIAWNLGFIPGIKAFTAAVLGGIGNIRGAMLGGLLLGLIENGSTICIGPEWKNVIAFTMLPLVLIFRPTGIMGERIGG